MSTSIKTFVYGLVISALLSVSVFALPMMAALHHHDGLSDECPLMMNAALCDMGVLDHFAVWQGLFVSIRPTEVLSLALGLLLLYLTYQSFYALPGAPPRRVVVVTELPTPWCGPLLFGTTISPRAP